MKFYTSARDDLSGDILMIHTLEKKKKANEENQTIIHFREKKFVQERKYSSDNNMTQLSIVTIRKTLNSDLTKNWQNYIEGVEAEDGWRK